MRHLVILLLLLVLPAGRAESPPSNGATAKAPWILIVNSTDDPKATHGREFLPLVRSVAGWEKTESRLVWVGDFNRALVETEPHPIAVFFSGSFKDWCEVDRATWRGVQEVLENAPLPIWASCGGAQALAIVSEYGVEKPWDCPHCRHPLHPKTPIYGHIGHTGSTPCGDYSQCIFERGLHQAKKLGNDPVFDGLPPIFPVMQSHCGQIEWAPKGWRLLATAGPDAKTKVQCIRRGDAPIYAAQFHIEMEGAPESSRTIMRNFLSEAEAYWKTRRN